VVYVEVVVESGSVHVALLASFVVSLYYCFSDLVEFVRVAFARDPDLPIPMVVLDDFSLQCLGYFLFCLFV